MHGETFTDLLADPENARKEWGQAFDQRLREMTGRLDGLV
jgi:hypothetical protein